MIGNTGKPKHQITKTVFEELKELYLGTQLGEEGIEAKSRFYELESQIKKTDRELSKLDAILFPGINSPDRAIYSACISYRDALGKGIACAITHHATQHESEATHSPDAATSATQHESEATHSPDAPTSATQHESEATHSPDAPTSATQHESEATHSPDAPTSATQHESEATHSPDAPTSATQHESEATHSPDAPTSATQHESEATHSPDAATSATQHESEATHSPDAPTSATQHESEAIHSPDAATSAQLIVDFLAVSSADTQTQEIQRGLRNAGIAIFHAMSGSRDEDDEETLNAESWAIVMHKFSEYKRISDNHNACTKKLRTLYEAIIEQKNIVMRDIAPTEERSKNPQDYFLGAGREHLETNGLLDDYNTFTPIIALLIDQYGFDRVTFELFEEYCKGHPPLPQATGLFQQPQSITANKEEHSENQMLHHDYPSGYQQAPPLDDEGHAESEPQYMPEGKPVAPKTRSRINESNISKAGLATSAGALIGFALLATSIGIAASIAAGRAPFLAQTPILSQNPFILTALMPAILGAITLALIVAAIARMRTNKDITLEFSLGHITQQDAMLLHGSIIRILAHDLPPEECDRISQRTSSELLLSIRDALEWQIHDIGHGTNINVGEALASPNHDPKIKVVSLVYSGSDCGETVRNSKIVITLRAGSMSEKKAWLGVIARCTPAQYNPESLHHGQHHSETGSLDNGPLALIAKTTKVTMHTSHCATASLIGSVASALYTCEKALIDASNKSKKEPSSIMSEHSISSPTASEQHRSN